MDSHKGRRGGEEGIETTYTLETKFCMHATRQILRATEDEVSKLEAKNCYRPLWVSHKRLLLNP